MNLAIRKQMSSLIFSLVLIFVTMNTTAQDKAVNIHPEKPDQGQPVTITYHPSAETAALPPGVDSLKLVLSYAPYLWGQPDEFEMVKNGSVWKTSFKLGEEFKFASFYFKLGDQTDKGPDGHHYEFFAYKDGTPAESSRLMKANSLKKRYPGLSDEELEEMQAELYREELEVHPDNFSVKTHLIRHRLKQENADTAQIKRDMYWMIDNYLASNPKTYPVINQMKSAYNAIGEKEKGEERQKEIIQQYPESDIAMYDLYQQANDVEDKDKQAEMYLEYVNADYDRSFINKYYTANAYQKLFNYYADKEKLDRMKAMAKRQLSISSPVKSTDYSSIAKTIAEKTNAYELALKYARKALELTDREPASEALTTTGEVERYVAKKQAEKLKNRRKSSILGTLGYIHLQMNNLDRAEEYLAQAEKLSKSNSTQEYLGMLYQKMDQPKKAFETYWDILLQEPLNEDIRKKLKETYIAYNGSDEGYQQKTAELDEAWERKMTEKFNKERIDKPAPSLAGVTDLQGNPIDTKILEGKVVVVDFWETWCGPCLRAFPHLQKVYDAYKDNPRVKFIVLNSAWNDKIKDARKWEKKNDYTFPLYYDKGSKVVNEYEVRGIPTTFVIDKEGNIQFKKVGFSGPEMQKNLSLKIDILLDELQAAKATSSSEEK